VVFKSGANTMINLKAYVSAALAALMFIGLVLRSANQFVDNGDKEFHKAKD
jgi:hypothetical protein